MSGLPSLGDGRPVGGGGASGHSGVAGGHSGSAGAPPAASAGPQLPSGPIGGAASFAESTRLVPASRLGWLDDLLLRTVAEKASDLHVMAGEVPRVRVRGELIRLDGVRPLVSGEIDTTVQRIVPEGTERRLVSEGEFDFAYTLEGYRFRVSAFAERRGTALAVRRLQDQVQPLEQLRLPLDLARAIYAPGGLVLLAGHAGAGKTTTMFSLLQEFCTRRTGHLITLEDPIEFRLEPKGCYLEQRELGRHFKSFRDGVRDALRASPDALAIGELRDTESIRLALQSAEAGLLVFATVHAYDVTRAITRMVNAFPVDEQLEARVALAYTVRMIAAQTLLKMANGQGRIPAVEVCHAGSALSALIREGKEHEITTLIEASRSRGMRTLDQSLVELAQSRVVAPEEAIFRSVRKENVERMLKG